jgi:hypothetical protein
MNVNETFQMDSFKRDCDGENVFPTDMHIVLGRALNEGSTKLVGKSLPFICTHLSDGHEETKKIRKKMRKGM